MLAERHILLDSLLFEIIITPEKEMALLAIPEVYVDKIITLRQSSLFAGHQSVIKTYLTIRDIPGLINYLCLYIKGCHICQLLCNEKPSARQLQTRVNLRYRPLSRLSMDLKVMSRSNEGHKYILCILDEVTIYLISVPIQQSRSEEIGDALTENVLMDHDSTFMSPLMSYSFKKLDIKIKTVAPYNHQSLQTEHGIKSSSTILTKYLASLGQM